MKTSRIGLAAMVAALSLQFASTAAVALPLNTLTAADIVTVDNRSWAQVSLFTNLSWNTVNAACPGGVCGGGLNGFNMAGWHWAYSMEVVSLFNAVTGVDISLTPNSGIFQSNSTWAPAWFNRGFLPTDSNALYLATKGISADPQPQTLGSVMSQPYVLDSFDPNGMDMLRVAGMIQISSIDPWRSSASQVGVWFYKDSPSSQVPEPNTLVLAALAFAGLGGMQYKSRH